MAFLSGCEYMNSRITVYALLGILLFFGAVEGGGQEAKAQNNRVTERSFVSSPVVLGMGDAGVALPGIEQSFFYNPAHLSQIPSHFTIFGIEGAASRTLEEHIRFYDRQVQPAVEKNFALSTASLDELRRDASALGHRPSRGLGAVLLPSFVYSPGALGVGGGLYAKTALNYRIDEKQAAIPSVWTLSRTDLMALLSLGLDLRVLGLTGASVGVTATQTRRSMAFKRTPLGPSNEQEFEVPLEGTSFQLDAGLTYSPGWASALPGTLRFGGAVYDVLENGYDYTAGGSGRLPFLDEAVGRSNGDSLDVSSEDVARAKDLFALKTSYRVGIAYQYPRLLFLEDIGMAVDYQGYQVNYQTPLARLHVGMRALLLDQLEIRGGLGSGYPSGGLGLRLGAFHLDYSIHGIEEGRRAGEVSTYLHTLRLLIRLQ